MTHSPTPWAVTKGKPRKVTANGVLICTAVLRNSGTTKQNKFGKREVCAEANAALIVHRVNNYEALRGHILNAAICLEAGGSKAEALRILDGALELSKDAPESARVQGE